MKKFIGALVVALPVPFLALLLLDKQALSQALANSDGSFVSAYLSSGGLVSVIGLGLISFALALVALAIASNGSTASEPQSSSRKREDSSFSENEGNETGTVKWFNVNKGFGFITTSEGEDVFVHFRSIRGSGRRSLRQGQSVRFDLTQGEKGVQAENVSVID